MPDGVGFSPTVDRALIVAALAHHDKVRKGTEIPYIMHPFHVALILQRHGFPDPVVIAGLLHDVVEDMRFGDETLQRKVAAAFPHAQLPVGVSHGVFREAFLGFLGSEFGPKVLELVMLVTEPKNDGGPGRTWLERRQVALDRLARAEPACAALKAADLLHNMRSVVRDLNRYGAPVMKRFNAGPDATLWYYETAAQLAAERLQPSHGLATEVLDAARELREVLEDLGLADRQL